jgi:hypothetical protein
MQGLPTLLIQCRGKVLMGSLGEIHRGKSLQLLLWIGKGRLAS